MLYRCQTPAKKHPAWSARSVVYELNVRQFTPSGTLAEAATHLDRLATLGIDIIWLMPIFPIGVDRRKGSLGSYYSIADYTAINPEFGTTQDAQDFVRAAQARGIKVILDWVANHTARDARWVAEHPEWYEWDSAKNEIATPFDWDDTAKLDYTNHEMRAEMIRSMRWWLDTIGLDGFRCDMAMLVPLDFWETAVAELTKDHEIFMLAEAEGPEFHRAAFDATYTWELHHIFNAIAKGEANAYTLGERLSYESSIYNGSEYRLLFTSNHDENSWNGSEWQRMGGGAPAFAALSFVLSGMPLLYNGQEVGLARSLAFFEKDPISWGEPSGVGVRMGELYKELIALKHNHPALEAGATGADLYPISNSEPWRVFALKRRVGDRIVMAIFNLSATDADVEFFDQDFNGEYAQIGSTASAHLIKETPFHLGPWGFFIYYR